MMRRLFLGALIACLAMPLAAQSGWKVRVDRSTNAQDPDNTPELKFMAMGKGFHVTGGPAGTFWNPANNATGNYTAKATFTLLKPSSHTNYYGLMFGGQDLDGAGQSYSYFVVAQNGTFLIKQRKGDQTTDVQGRMAHAAIKQPDAQGSSVNALEVRVAGDTVSYVVNGTVVHTTPKSAVATDGLAGFRVNHVLDVQVDGFEIVKGA
jgi:hypothetical protein